MMTLPVAASDDVTTGSDQSTPKAPAFWAR